MQSSRPPDRFIEGLESDVYHLLWSKDHDIEVDAIGSTTLNTAGRHPPSTSPLWFLDTMWPKYSARTLKKVHFVILHVKPAHIKRSNTKSRRWSICWNEDSLLSSIVSHVRACREYPDVVQVRVRER
eukprot:scaffold1012_cov124-Isochrysis_galbana.AAC.1